ncbi:hypothetical protein HanIR_Chr16g0813351 [Helianthus annuus]|nr:hypothetical protein HanIR_Chr16g0813351 [Helianthus annuus]
MREIEIRGGEGTASPSAVAAGLAGVIRGGDDGVFSGNPSNPLIFFSFSVGSSQEPSV